MSSDPRVSRTTPEDDAPRTETSSGSSRPPVDAKAQERAERAARAKERSTSTDRVRRYRERKKAQETTAEPSETTDAEVAECGAVFALIYDLALVPVTGGRLGPLETEQSERAGRVLAPLVRKYAPLLGDYGQEIAAVLVLGSIFRSNWREPPSPELEVVHAETE